LNAFNFESKENELIFLEFHNYVKDNEEVMREISDGSFQDWGYFDGIVGEYFVPFLKSKGFNSAIFFDTGVEGMSEEVVAVFDLNAIS